MALREKGGQEGGLEGVEEACGGVEEEQEEGWSELLKSSILP